MRSVLLCSLVFVVASGKVAWADESPAVTLQWGPIKGAATAAKTLSLGRDVQHQASVYDVQDGREHNVRGVSLAELLKHIKAPKAVDAVVFIYADGMQIPVKRSDAAELDNIFVAFEHGDVLNHFGATYPVQKKFDLTCPKVIYKKEVTTYSLWHYPTQLQAIRLVTWKVYEAGLAQPTRHLPDRSGWPLYLKHCQSCHGIGGQGAKRGPDFLSNMDAYRRVPPLAETDQSQHPSLHEKVKGFTEGTMPVLNHVSNAEIATLWRWLHAIHRSATK
ncbi:MAG: cytochrome c [Deltaproteobacteria bacterium]|nr:cytochrome c [Deltaproteobacteria bacterium]